MRTELQSALDAAKALAVEDVPGFLGALEEIRIVALAILMRPAAAPPDRLLDISELADRLHVSADYIYRNKKKYAAFERTQGAKLLWSSAGLDSYLRKSK